ncbi:hypothetical protein [Vibrio ziniensis]|uniref:Uncharacterized protein n=1 Tax=Vibrio ziniensis TaxID=2711221 RepID=A0A6G7CMX0_9VIBR|nr:hypothetical protein [Vibrio ziniensis]QIH43445.1 hypothetical protein G5S32_15725 [Vibrio ziniensis]
MRVRATLKNDYLLSMEYWERNHFYALSLPEIVPTSFGFTFAKYTEVPNQMVEGAKFLDGVQPRTRAINCATDFLEELGYTLDVNIGEFIKIENLPERANRTIETDAYRFVCNHIPQLYYPYKGKRIVAIDGDFDLTTQIFKGALSFA